MSVLHRKKSQHHPSRSRPWFNITGLPPLVTWQRREGAVPCWALERNTTLCVLWRLISCLPWLWFTALCSHSALGSEEHWILSWLCEGWQSAAGGQCPGEGRGAAGLAQVWLCSSFPPRVLPAPHTHPWPLPRLFTLFFFVLPNDRVPVFSPIQALPHSVIQTLIKTPLAMHLKPFLHLGEVKRLKQDGEQAVRKNVIYSACWHQPTPLILKHLDSGNFDLYTEISCYFFNCCIFYFPATSRGINKSVKPAAASALVVSVQALTKVMFTEVFSNSSFSLQGKKWVQHG